MSDTLAKDLPRCGLLRRLAVILYDSLILLALLFIGSAFSLIFTGGEAEPGNPFISTFMLFIAFGFYAWFWTHGGQTIGMRAWRVRVQTRDGKPISLWQALLRFLVAIPSWGLGGLGFLWCLWDKESMTWHDRYSETALVVTPREKNKG